MRTDRDPESSTAVGHRSSREARALYFEEPGSVTVRREQVHPRENEVMVTSRLIGISHGTEMLFYHGPFPSGQLAESISHVGDSSGYPIKYGYMNVGETPSGNRVFAFFPHQDRFALPSSELIPIPPDISDEDAVLYPSVETALQITHDAAPVAGEQVVVAGLGVIGMLVARILSGMRVDVLALDPLASRRQQAETRGISTADPGDPGVSEQIRERTGGRGADVFVNVSAHPSALQLGLDVLATEGTAVEASWYGEKPADLTLGTGFHRRRLTIRSSQVSRINPGLAPRWDHARRTRVTWELVRELNPGRMISHRIPLDEAAGAYELIARQREDVLQVVLVP